MMSERGICPECRRRMALKKDGTLRKHADMRIAISARGFSRPTCEGSGKLRPGKR
jgi:hypothetical protein